MDRFALLTEFLERGIPFNKHLGIKAIILEKGHARLEIPFREEMIGDPMRPALHGGVLSTLADTAGGAAVFASVEDPRSRVSTIDLRIDYMRPAKLETLVGDAHIARIGNKVAVVDVRLFHPSQEGATLATGKGVYNISVAKKDS